MDRLFPIIFMTARFCMKKIATFANLNIIFFTMKKIGLFMMVTALFLLVSCSKNTPKGVVKTYYNALIDKDYEKSAQCFCTVSELGGDEEAQMKGIAGKLKESVETYDGIKSYEILRDSVCSDSVVMVYANFVWGNGEKSQSDIRVVKQNGEWKIDPMSK